MPDTRDRVFDRVVVDHLVRGETRVSWGVLPSFFGAEPYSFQLQWGRTGDPLADDWEDVGAPARNVFSSVDGNRRVHGGMTAESWYRVVMTDGDAVVHYSEPAHVYGVMNKHDWLMAHEVVRKERLRGVGFVAAKGVLLKRRRTGESQQPPQALDPRTAVLDPLTGEVVRRQTDAATYGTGLVGGYYKPIDWWVDMPLQGTYARAEEDSGNVDPEAMIYRGCRMPMLPSPASYDVFVASGSDARYVIHEIKAAAHVRGVPLVASCELRKLPLSDVLYTLDPAAL